MDEEEGEGRVMSLTAGVVCRVTKRLMAAATEERECVYLRCASARAYRRLTASLMSFFRPRQMATASSSSPIASFDAVQFPIVLCPFLTEFEQVCEW